MDVRHIAITNDIDGYQLAATVYQGPVTQLRGCVIVASAMGVPRQFYDGFGRWLVGEGLACVTFDFRGMFQSPSLNPNARARDVALIDWGADLDSVTRWCGKAFQDAPLYAACHSMGGHVLGFAPAARCFTRILLIGCGSVYWGCRPTRVSQGLHAVAWYMLVPALATLLGSFPGRKLGIVGDLPRRIAVDWARWCRDPDYVRGAEHGACSFDHICAPVMSLSLEGDTIISESAVRAFGAYFERTVVRYSTIERATLPPDATVHFDVFRRQSAGHLWPSMLRWLTSGTTGVSEVRGSTEQPTDIRNSPPAGKPANRSYGA